MKRVILLSAMSALLTTGCSPFASYDNQQSSGSSFDGGGPAGANVVAIEVGCGYVNEPCVTVTICAPNDPSRCMTIPDVLLDTGSFGLRVFNNNTSVPTGSTMVQTLGLSLVTSGGGQLAECQSYLDNSSDWGPVANANVTFGRTANNIPIQIIESNFAGIPSTCGNPDTAPANMGYNGIIGVGQFIADCGPGCAETSSNETYYSCSGANCTNVALAEAQQVSNPVAFFPVDNNGVVLKLPAVAPGTSGGATTLSGSLILGIATEANNIPVGTKTYQADGNGNFNTVFNGVSLSQSFIDSGSQALGFPQPASVAACSNTDPNAAGFFCPTTEASLVASVSGAGQAQNTSVSFQIGNASYYLSNSDPAVVFSDLGAPLSGSSFDWGLPFFFGKSVYVGIEGTSSFVGTGPFWAF